MKPSDPELSLSGPVELPFAENSAGAARGAGYLRAILRRWRLMGGTVVVCTVLATLYALLARPVYRGTAVLAVDAEGAAVGGAPGQVDILYAGSSLLRSDDVLRAAVASPGAQAILPPDGDDAVEQLSRVVHVEVSAPERVIRVSADASTPADAAALANAVADSYLDFLVRQAIEEQVRQGPPENLTLTAPHEVTAGATAGAGATTRGATVAVATTTREATTTTTTQPASTPAPAAQRPARAATAAPQVATAPKAPTVDPAQQALADFTREHPEFLTPESALAVGSQFAKLTETLTAARITAAEAQAAHEATDKALTEPEKAKQLARANRGKGLYGSLDQDTDHLETEIDEQEKQMALRAKAVGPRNPMQVKAQEKIDAMRARLDELDQRKARIYAVYVEQQADVAAAKVIELEGLVRQEKDRAARYAALSEEYAAMRSAAREARFTALQRSMPPPPATGTQVAPGETAATSDAAMAPSPLAAPRRPIYAPSIGIHVEHSALPPSAPIRPRRLRIVGAGMIGGLLLGLGLAFIASVWPAARPREMLVGEIVDDPQTDGADGAAGAWPQQHESVL